MSDTNEPTAPTEPEATSEPEAAAPEATTEPQAAAAEPEAAAPAEPAAAEAAAPAEPAAAEPAPAEPEPEPAPEPDPVRDALVEALRADLGDGFLDANVAKGDVVVRVDRSSWRRAAETLKTRHGFDYFCFLSGIDWLKSAELTSRYEQVYGGDEAEEAADDGSGPYLGDRVAGGEGRFTVLARLYNTNRKLGITLKADLGDTDPTVDSWTSVYRGADWHEREAWEMFGFDFTDHPGLRHIYLPAEFEGYPLRKDFALLARVVKPWPGLVDKEPVPGEDEEQEEANA